MRCKFQKSLTDYMFRAYLSMSFSGESGENSDKFPIVNQQMNFNQSIKWRHKPSQHFSRDAGCFKGRFIPYYFNMV